MLQSALGAAREVSLRTATLARRRKASRSVRRTGVAIARVTLPALAAIGMSYQAAAQVAPTQTWTATGTGTWSTGSNWSPIGPPTSAATTILQFNASGTTSYTATNDIANPFVLNGLLFNTTSSNQITIDGSPLQFTTNGSATPVLNLASGSTGQVLLNNNLVLQNNLSVNDAGTGTVTAAGALSGTGSLTLQTAGTLKLTGANGAWTGSTAINRGTLVLDFTTDNTSKINSAGTLTFGTSTGAIGGGGTLTITGNAGADTTQAVTGTTFNPGLYTLNVNSAASQTTTLDLGVLTRNPGSSVFVNFGGAGTSILHATAPASDTVLGNVIVGGSDFALHRNADGNIVANTTYTNQSDASLWAATDNVTNTAAYTGNTSGAATINSLRFNAAAASSFAVGAASSTTDSLTITTGGILITSAVGSNASTIALNTGSTNSIFGPFIASPSTTDLTITNNSSGTLTINPNIGTATSTPRAIVKNGPGAVTISSAAMLFSANGLFVNSGTLNVGTNVTLNTTAFNNATYAQRNPMGTTAAGVATPVTLGDGATINVAFGTAANLTATFGNTIRVPQGTATFNGTSVSGAATALITLGGITFGDGARLNLNDGSSGVMRYQFTQPITISPGAAGQPSSATLNITGGQFHTFTGGIVGAAGGSQLNLLGGNTFTFTSATAATNLTQINVGTSATRLYMNNSALLGTAAATGVKINLATNTFFINDQNATNAYAQLFTVASGAGLSSRQGTASWITTGLPSSGSLLLNNDNSATAAISLVGNYPALTGAMTFQFAGTQNGTAGNAIGATTITGSLDASSAAFAGAYTLTANYSPGTASTSTPATSNLLTVSGTTLIGANNLTVAGSGSITLGNISTTGAGTNTISKTGTNFLTMAGTTSTFSGGVSIVGGAGLGISASSTVTGGVISGGPLGTGTLTVGAASTIRENGGGIIRTIHNNVILNGSETFSSLGANGTSGGISFDDAGLATPSTLTLNAASNPTFTINDSVFFSRAINVSGGMTGFTKAGGGTLTLDGDYIDTGTVTVSAGTLVLTANATTSASFSVSAGATIRVEGSSAAFNNADNKVTLAAGATAVRGAGVDLTEFQQWLGSTGSTSIVSAIGSDTSENISFSGNSGLRLGSAPAGYVYSGTLTPDGTTYRLGGGGGILFFKSQLTGASNSVDVGSGGSSGGDVYLTNTTNNFGGGINLSSANALDVKDGAALSTGTVTFGVANAILLTTGPTTISNQLAMTAAGTVDNGGNALTLSGGFSGTGALTLNGRGTTTLTTGITTAIPVIANAGLLTTALTGSPFGGANFVQNGNVTLSTGGAVTTTIANTGAATYTYNAGILNVGASGSPGATVTLGGTGSSFVRGTLGTLVLAPANGTANLGSAAGETIKVGGTAPTSTNGVVAGVFARDTNAAGTATFVDYGANGFVPSTYTPFAGGTFTGVSTTNYDFTTGAATVATAQSANAVRTNQSVTATGVLTVGTGGVILSNNPTISGAGGLAYGATDGKIYTEAAGATISAPIAGTGGLTVTGPGKLTLSGLNVFTGNLVVDGGILAFGGYIDTVTTSTGTPQGAGGNRTTILNGGGTLRLLSGSFNPVGSGRFLQIGAGGGTIDVVNASTVYQLDDAGQIASAAGTAGALFLTNSGTGNATVHMSNQTYAINGPIIVGSSTGTVTYQYGNNNATSITSTLGNGMASALTLNSGGIFDMRTTTPWARTIVLNGGSIISGASNGGTINGVVYSTGGGSIGGANLITINGETVIDGNATLNLNGAANTNFVGAISGALNTTAGVTKTAAGIVIFSGNNTYGGTTLISAGTLRGNDGTGLSPNTNISINGGTLETGANLTRGIGTGAGQLQIPGGTSAISAFGGNVVANFGGSGAQLVWGSAAFNPLTLVLNQATATGTLELQNDLALGATQRIFTISSTTAATAVTLSGVISGTATAGTLALTKNGANTSNLILSGANTFPGNIAVTNGSLTVTNSSALGSGTKTVDLTAGTAGNCQLHLDGSAGDITLPAAVSYTTSNSSTNGTVFNEAGDNTIAGAFTLTAGGGGTIFVVNAGSLTLSGNLTPNTTARVLSLRGAGNGLISGKIQDGSSTNVLAGFNKDSGTGTWTLTGANTYSTATTITAGSLYVNGSHNAANAGTTIATNYVITGSVANGPATFGGIGAITLKQATDTATASGAAGARGIIGPGASLAAIGTLTFTGGSGVVFGANSQFTVDTDGTNADQLAVGGATGNFSAATATDLLAVNASVVGGPYTILTYTGTRTGTFDAVTLNSVTETGTLAGNTFTADSGDLTVFYDDANKQVLLTVNNVPEPTGLAAIGLLNAGLLARRRRRG